MYILVIQKYDRVHLGKKSTQEDEWINEMRYWVIVFNATFNNISVISWWSVLLEEETGVPAKKTFGLPQVTDKFYHIMLYQVHLASVGFKFTLVNEWMIVMKLIPNEHFLFRYFMIKISYFCMRRSEGTYQPVVCCFIELGLVDLD
jgi:hypothetical protein